MCIYSSPKGFWPCLSFILPSNKAFCGSLARGIAGIFASCHVAKSKTGPLAETSHTLWLRLCKCDDHIFLFENVILLSFWNLWEHGLSSLFFGRCTCTHFSSLELVSKHTLFYSRFFFGSYLLVWHLLLAHASWAWHLLFIAHTLLDHF